MLTRSKKKRLAGKDKNCPQNSIQTYSVVPGNDAVEVGEMVTMVTMDHAATRGGLDNDRQRTDYLQVAWLLREKLNDLVDGDKGEFPGLGLRSLLDMAASSNIVSVDPKMLDPVLWRTLPMELLLLVFASLPLSDITRLRCLSREWRREMATPNSEINQACDEAIPPMVALLSHSATDTFLVTIYDIKNCSCQYIYHLRLQRPWNDDLEPHTWTAIDACDGGLVCFMSLWIPTKQYGLCFVVVNLLTRVHHELPPPHYRYNTLPAMVQIKVDVDTKCYKVVVAAHVKGRPAAEIYDSVTRQWTRAAPPFGSISGPVYTWTNCVDGWCRESSATAGAYHVAERKFELYSETPSIGGTVIAFVLGKDRVFLLLEQTQMDASLGTEVHHSLCITEYHFEKQTKDWVEGKSYACPSYEELTVEEPLSGMYLKACDGFLMVIVHHLQRSQYFWLLDLSTSEWSELQKPFKELHTKGSMFCRPFWNVIP